MCSLKDSLLKIHLVIDNEYLDKYVELIEKNYATVKQAFITQEHHIIPRYYYKSTNSSIDNTASNKVHLTYAEHLLAHYYLMMCSYNDYYEFCNANAIYQDSNNIHSNISDEELINLSNILQEINYRRCELISLHHADVSGTKNPRATMIYKYDLNGNLIFTYYTLKECAEDINFNPDSLRSIVSKNKIYYHDNYLLSKLNYISKEQIHQILTKKQKIIDSKRFEYNFTCERCGTLYVRKLTPQQFSQRNVAHNYCYACTKSGIIFKGIPKGDEQKQKMSLAKKINDARRFQSNEKI